MKKKKADLPVNNLALGERIRFRREELRWTREELVDRIRIMSGRLVSLSTIKSMERPDRRYKLPRRKWGDGAPILEHVANALDVPLGYLLAGFCAEELAASHYGRAVEAGRLPLVPYLRNDGQKALRSFIDTLPTTENELFALPLHSYKNQFAVAVIFQIERLFPGLEMLLVNEPPFIFWDEEDIAMWIENMNFGHGDRLTFQQEFANYRRHYRGLVDAKKSGTRWS